MAGIHLGVVQTELWENQKLCLRHSMVVAQHYMEIMEQNNTDVMTFSLKPFHWNTRDRISVSLIFIFHLLMIFWTNQQIPFTRCSSVLLSPTSFFQTFFLFMPFVLSGYLSLFMYSFHQFSSPLLTLFHPSFSVMWRLTAVISVLFWKCVAVSSYCDVVKAVISMHTLKTSYSKVLVRSLTWIICLIMN